MSFSVTSKCHSVSYVKVRHDAELIAVFYFAHLLLADMPHNFRCFFFQLIHLLWITLSFGVINIVIAFVSYFFV